MRLLLPVQQALLFSLLFPGLISGWIDEKVVNIGGKSYVERREQPWFRYPHPDHERIELEKKDESAFGKHYIPEEDIFIQPFWTEEEVLYLPCLTRQCVCPYFRGELFFYGVIFIFSFVQIILYLCRWIALVVRNLMHKKVSELVGILASYSHFKAAPVLLP